MSQDQKQLYGTSHAVGLIGCSPSHLRSLVDRGIVRPIVTSTGRHVYTPANIAEAIEYRMQRKAGRKFP